MPRPTDDELPLDLTAGEPGKESTSNCLRDRQTTERRPGLREGDAWRTTTECTIPTSSTTWLRMPGGEQIKVCFSCGTCTAGCPVTDVDDRDTARARSSARCCFGQRQAVLSNPLLWYCETCYACSAYCPAERQVRGRNAGLARDGCRRGLLVRRDACSGCATWTGWHTTSASTWYARPLEGTDVR